MTRSLPRSRAVLVPALLGLLGLAALAACTTPSDDASSDAAVASDDEPVTVALVVADLGLLTEQNLAPDLGDPVAVGEAVVDEINEAGGAGGHQIELSSHVIPGVENLEPEGGRAACLEATQEGDAFVAVMTPAVSFDVARCLAVQNETLTMSMASWDDELYSDAEGRLFAGATNVSIGVERSFGAWPGMLVDAGALDDTATVGIVRVDLPTQELGTDNALKPALDDLGIEVAAEAVLPCEAGVGCSQHDVAIQRMKDAAVDFVFLVAPTTLGVDVVQAAVDLDFHPEWATIGENVTDTVAQFFDPVKDEWDGAWGVDTTYLDREEAAECNRIIADRAGLDYPPDSDQYGFAAVVCLELQIVASAIAEVEGPLTQAGFIAAMEGLGEVPSAEGPRGSFGPDKHDAGNAQFLSRYSAADGRFIDVEGTSTEVD